MLPKDCLALVIGAVAIFWAVVWFVLATWLGILWLALWVIVLALDYSLYRESAPGIPSVQGEIVDTTRAELEDAR